MGNTQHATLSPSSSHRWIACPPSAIIPQPESSGIPNEFAMQGTDAHELCEYKLKKYLGCDFSDPTEKLDYFNQEMQDATDGYAEYVIGIIESARKECNDPLVLVEQKLDFSDWVPKGFGTGDCVIVSNQSINVIDFKYGLGVLVDAEENSQMMCYALGALNLYDVLYDIQNITMTIYQPRRSNISTWTVSKEDLLDWAEKILRPAAELAIEGKGGFKAGDHCRFCPGKATCRARAEYNMSLARYDFEAPESLTGVEIEAILEKADQLVSWVNDIKEFALSQALEGKSWSNWKVVEGRATRKYMDDEVVASKVKEAGFDPYEHKILGITAMKKMLGAKKFNELLEEYIVKPQGKPTLVKREDKREEMNNPVNDFKEEK